MRIEELDWGSLLCEAYDYIYIITYTLNFLAYSAHRDPNAYLCFLIFPEFFVWEEIPILWCFANSYGWIIVWRNFGHPILNYSYVIFLFSLAECFLGSIWCVCSCSSDLHHSLCKSLKAFSADKKDQWKRRRSRWGVNPVSTMNCPFPSSKTFHFQNEAYCKSFLINMSFYIAIHENENSFLC